MSWGEYFLKSKLRAFSYTQDGLKTPRRRYKKILERRTKHDQFIAVFARPGGRLENKLPEPFQVAIRFHPDHPWPKALVCGFSALVE